VSVRGTVFLVDDDEAVRRATARLLDAWGFEVRAYASAEEYLVARDPQAPGCLLLDLRMPGQSGIELQTALLASGGAPATVFLTAHADVPTTVAAMKQGAVDLLEKPAREDQLVAALERALQRDLDQRRTRGELAELERRYDSLTQREREVLAGVVRGLRNKQSATSLGIAERTVKLHRARVLEKMGASSAAEVARMVEKLGKVPEGA
jgi:FixJ family two-component response regulator